VSGWDDPRMPTICGIRRRGYTPESMRMFAEKVGVAKRDNVIDLSLLEWCVREDLNRRAARRMAVLNPVKLVIADYPEGKIEEVEATNNPEDPSAGTRRISFGRELYIERDDFMENPPKKFFRLAPGQEVRLKYVGYIIRCTEVIKNDVGDITEIRCTHDPDKSRSVKGTIHWVSASHCKPAEVRLFDRLFTEPLMDELPEGKSYTDFLNPDSLKKITALVEQATDGAYVKGALPLQFERLGYFAIDPESTGEKIVFNRTVTLKDTWAKVVGK